jgi:hypothetical protein
VIPQFMANPLTIPGQILPFAAVNGTIPSPRSGHDGRLTSADIGAGSTRARPWPRPMERLCLSRSEKTTGVGGGLQPSFPDPGPGRPNPSSVRVVSDPGTSLCRRPRPHAQMDGHSHKTVSLRAARIVPSRKHQILGTEFRRRIPGSEDQKRRRWV